MRKPRSSEYEYDYEYRPRCGLSTNVAARISSYSYSCSAQRYSYSTAVIGSKVEQTDGEDGIAQHRSDRGAASTSSNGLEVGGVYYPKKILDSQYWEQIRAAGGLRGFAPNPRDFSGISSGSHLFLRHGFAFNKCAG